MGCMWAQASAFTVHLGVKGSPITPELYGQAAYEIPALAWMKLQEVPSLIGMIGAMLSQSYRSSLRRVGAFMTGIAATILACLYGVFAVFSHDAEQGAHVFYICTVVGIPMTMFCAVAAGRHFFWGADA